MCAEQNHSISAGSRQETTPETRRRSTSTRTTTREHVTVLFQGFAGQGNTLIIPRPYIDFCKGDHLAALLLSQILYWADRTGDPEGWFAKSYDEWYIEIGMTEYQVRRAIQGDRRGKQKAFSLKSVGIETDRRPSKYHRGGVTLHYRVNYAKLNEAVAAFVSGLNNGQGGTQTMLRMVPEQCSGTLSETISETINHAPDGAGGAMPSMVEPVPTTDAGPSPSSVEPTTKPELPARAMVRDEVIAECKFAETARGEREVYGRAGKITKYLSGEAVKQGRDTYRLARADWAAQPGDFARFARWWRGKFPRTDVPRSLEVLHERWAEWREVEARTAQTIVTGAVPSALDAERALYGEEAA